MSEWLLIESADMGRLCDGVLDPHIAVTVRDKAPVGLYLTRGDGVAVPVTAQELLFAMREYHEAGSMATQITATIEGLMERNLSND